MGANLYYLPRVNFVWKKSDGWVTTGTLKTDPSDINSFIITTTFVISTVLVKCPMKNDYKYQNDAILWS